MSGETKKTAKCVICRQPAEPSAWGALCDSDECSDAWEEQRRAEDEDARERAREDDYGRYR